RTFISCLSSAGVSLRKAVCPQPLTHSTIPICRPQEYAPTYRNVLALDDADRVLHSRERSRQEVASPSRCTTVVLPPRPQRPRCYVLSTALSIAPDSERGPREHIRAHQPRLSPPHSSDRLCVARR